MDRSSRQASLLLGLREVIGALVIAGAVLAPAYAFAADKEAIAWLKVGDDPAKILQRRGAATRDPGEYEQFRKTQAALIKSPDVLRAALKNPAIANLKLLQDQDNPEEWLKGNLTVAFPLESEVLQIKLKADNKADAVKIVNAVRDSYLQNVVDLERQKIAAASDLFNREVKALMAEITEKQETLTVLSLRTNSDSASASLARAKFTKVLEVLTDLQKKSYDTDLQIIASRIRAEDSEAPPVDRRQSKINLSIGEAQKKYLNEKLAEVKESLEHLATVSGRESGQSAVLRDEIKRKQELLRDLEAKQGQLRLLMNLPNRVTPLMDATE
jgi:hypothetical protein